MYLTVHNIQQEPIPSCGCLRTLLFTTDASFTSLNNNELCILVSLANKTLQERGVATTNFCILSKSPDMFNNAKFEQIACTGLKPQYDSMTDALIPTLNPIHIRQQNEVWYLVTFLQDGIQVNLIR